MKRTLLPEEISALDYSKMTFCVVTPSKVIQGQRQGMSMAAKLLIEFLIPKSRFLVAIDHPFQTDPDRTPLMELYSKGQLVRKDTFGLPSSLARGRRAASSLFFYFTYKALDFVSSVIFVVRARKVLDVYVGVESVSALAGLLLRRMGRVRRVIYYCIDLLPGRFGFFLPNMMFLGIDRYCSQHSDINWNSKPETSRTRQMLWGGAFAPKQILVPDSSPVPQEVDFEPRSGHEFAYLGGLSSEYGVQTVISAMPAILRKVQGARFHVIGKGQFGQRLRELSENLGVAGNVSFHGYLTDADVKSVFSRCRAGVAPYNAEILQFAAWQSPYSSKTWFYASQGLPIVFSESLPQFASLIERFHAGVTAEPSPAAFAEAIVALLTNENLYRNCLSGCRSLANAYSSELIFRNSFEQSRSHLTGI